MDSRFVERERHLHGRIAQLANRGIFLEGDRVAAALELGHGEYATADDDDGDDEEHADADVSSDKEYPPISLGSRRYRLERSVSADVAARVRKLVGVIEQGAHAPDFTLPDQEGDAVSLSDFSGSPVVLYFYPRAGRHTTLGSNERHHATARHRHRPCLPAQRSPGRPVPVA